MNLYQKFITAASIFFLVLGLSCEDAALDPAESLAFNEAQPELKTISTSARTSFSMKSILMEPK